MAGAGAGTRPLHVYGKVYLAGPYKGAPLSVVAVDSGGLGAVRPRQRRRARRARRRPEDRSGDRGLRPAAADLRRDSAADPVDPGQPRPARLHPQPDELRTVRRSRRPLTETKVRRRVSSASFQVANCADLPFAPKLDLNLTGGLKRRGHPAIRAVLTASPGEANTRRVSVTLPKGELLDNATYRNDLHQGRLRKGCLSQGSLIGSAEVTTPALDQPLKGMVYLRASSNKLPDLVVDLKGQYRHRTGRRGSTASGVACAPASKLFPTLPSPNSCSSSRGARRVC